MATKPWLALDFSRAIFPADEKAFYEHLNRANKGGLVPPVIEGKVVNLYSLFNLVHKNGGSARVSSLFC